MPRLFFGVRPPATIRKKMVRALREFFQLKRVGLSCSRPENWHITVHFIGNVSPFAAKKIKERFRTQKMPPGGTITLGGKNPLAWFGDRILYARVNDDGTALIRAHTLAREWAPVHDTHVYTPHLTLARTKKSPSKEKKHEKIDVNPFTFTFNVRELILFESRPRGGETGYIPLVTRRFSKGKPPK